MKLVRGKLLSTSKLLLNCFFFPRRLFFSLVQRGFRDFFPSQGSTADIKLPTIEINTVFNRVVFFQISFVFSQLLRCREIGGG